MCFLVRFENRYRVRRINGGEISFSTMRPSSLLPAGSRPSSTGMRTCFMSSTGFRGSTRGQFIDRSSGYYTDSSSSRTILLLASLVEDVAHFVRSCRVCAAAKSSNQLRMGAESFATIPIEPFSHWAPHSFVLGPAVINTHTPGYASHWSLASLSFGQSLEEVGWS